MARPKLIIVPLILSVIASFTAVILQLYGVILTWKIHLRQQEEAVCMILLRKQSYWRRKCKKLRQRYLRRKERSCWHKPGRTDLWWENILNGLSPEESWRKNFRMSKDDFMELVTELRPYIAPKPGSPNYRSFTAEKKLAITLYYLKDTGSLIMTANSFGAAICTVSCIILEVCTAISKHLGPKYLHLPLNDEDMRKTVAEFESKFGMTQAFGCIDGTHVPIQCPIENSQDFFCYKQFYSINVQAVCDYKGYFMDVECMWPGSVHDAKVFANSSINYKLRQGVLSSTFQCPFEGGEKIPNYLIGDPAYPLVPFCMKEYESCSNNQQVIFNNMLRSARNPIECAFGRLKARWSILTRKMDLKIETIPIVVYACFVLHNFCEKNNTYIDEDLVQFQLNLIKQNEAQYKNMPDQIYSLNEGEGDVVRRTLTTLILKNI